MSTFRTDAPTFEKMLDVRDGRQHKVTDFLAGATPELLPDERNNPWGEHGMNRERVGEFIQRIGLGNFLEQIGLDPEPEMVIHPRTNPYIFFELEEEE